MSWSIMQAESIQDTDQALPVQQATNHAYVHSALTFIHPLNYEATFFLFFFIEHILSKH